MYSAEKIMDSLAERADQKYENWPEPKALPEGCRGACQVIAELNKPAKHATNVRSFWAVIDSDDPPADPGHP